MIERYSIDLIKPDWPKWKKNIVNFILFNLRFLHIRPVNRMIQKYKHKDGGDFIQAVLDDIGIEYECHGLENVPEKGAVTYVANHPGGADVVVSIAAMWKRRHDFRILANKLICVKNVVDLVIPVDLLKKKNKVDESMIHKAYKEGRLVTFYAAGKNSRYNENGELRDRRWRSSFLDFAFQYKTPIIVAKINSANTPLFYRVSKFRENSKFLKNIPLENMFQLREIFKQKRNKVDIYMAQIIPFEEWSQHYRLGDTKCNRMLADKLYNFVYSLDNKTDKIVW